MTEFRPSDLMKAAALLEANAWGNPVVYALRRSELVRLLGMDPELIAQHERGATITADNGDLIYLLD